MVRLNSRKIIFKDIPLEVQTGVLISLIDSYRQSRDGGIVTKLKNFPFYVVAADYLNYRSHTIGRPEDYSSHFDFVSNYLKSLESDEFMKRDEVSNLRENIAFYTSDNSAIIPGYSSESVLERMAYCLTKADQFGKIKKVIQSYYSREDLSRRSELKNLEKELRAGVILPDSFYPPEVRAEMQKLREKYE